MPEWNVFLADWNQKKIVGFNIFRHANFMAECDEAFKKCHGDREYFDQIIDRSLMYYYWCKCEWEILICDFPYNDNFKPDKVDVYDQVKLNWDKFINYLWNYYQKGSMK